MISLPVKRGASFSRIFYAIDGAGEPVSLADCTAQVQLRSASGSLYFDSNDDVNSIDIDAVAGTITLTIPAVTMASLPIIDYYGDIKMIFSGADVIYSDNFEIPLARSITE